MKRGGTGGDGGLCFSDSGDGGSSTGSGGRSSGGSGSGGMKRHTRSHFINL